LFAGLRRHLVLAEALLFHPLFVHAMKSICSLFLAAFWLLGYAASAQDAPLTRFIQEHKNDKGISHALLSKDMLEVVSDSELSRQDWKQVQRVVKNIGTLQILAGEDLSNSVDLFREARQAIPENDFDELLSVRDAQDQVRIWTKNEEDVLSDLVLLVGTPKAFVLVAFSGRLELGNFTELAQLFNAGESAELARAAAANSMEFSVSPNPATTFLNIRCADTEAESATATLIDNQGRQRLQARLNNGQVQIPADLPAGNYWLQLGAKDGKMGIRQVQIIR
jgi:hypothetical protein